MCHKWVDTDRHSSITLQLVYAYMCVCMWLIELICNFTIIKLSGTWQLVTMRIYLINYINKYVYNITCTQYTLLYICNIICNITYYMYYVCVFVMFLCVQACMMGLRRVGVSKTFFNFSLSLPPPPPPLIRSDISSSSHIHRKMLQS